MADHGVVCKGGKQGRAPLGSRVVALLLTMVEDEEGEVYRDRSGIQDVVVLIEDADCGI
jgi:hypothetical protein